MYCPRSLLSCKEVILKRKLIALVGILTFGLIFAVPGTASASQGQCYSGYFCLWEHSGYGGAFRQWSPSINVCYNLSNDYINNRATSVWNNSGGTVRVWDGVCSGSSNSYTGGLSADHDLSYPPFSPLNDKISSFKKTS